MKERLLFIVNPISGFWAKQKVEVLVEKYLDKGRYEYEVRFTERMGHGTALAKEAVEDGFDVIVAVGGDGSINDVANGIKGTEARMGIIAVGSGNGLAQHLGLPIRNIPKALEVLNQGQSVSIDTVSSNKRNFLSNAGTGADASVARRFRHHKIRGFFSYVWAIIRQLLFQYKPISVEFEIDGQKYCEPTYTLGVFNTKYYGYGIGPFKHTSLRDGKLDVLHMLPFPRWKLAYVALMIILRRTVKLKGTRRFQAKRVLIKGNPKGLFQFDGDSEIISEDLEMKVETRNLKVIIPREKEIDEL